MKKILIFSVFILSCTSEPTGKFKEGELVYVGKEAFIVWQNRSGNIVELKKIDCRSTAFGCYYEILESEITKEPK